MKGCSLEISTFHLKHLTDKYICIPFFVLNPLFLCYSRLHNPEGNASPTHKKFCSYLSKTGSQHDSVTVAVIM